MTSHRAVLTTLLLSATLARAAPVAPWGTGESRGEDLTVTLVTFGPSDDGVDSYFGHSALVVEDSRLHQSRLYNYGMFDFDWRMLLKFVGGRLEFWVGEARVEGTIDFYRSLNRDVTLQVLNLDLPARESL